MANVRPLPGTTTIDDDGHRRHTRPYSVDLEAPGATQVAAIIACPVARFSLHPEDIYAHAKTVSVNPIAGFLGRYEVTFEYDTRPIDFGSGDPTGSPGQQGQEGGGGGGTGGGGSGSPPADPTARIPVYKYTNARYKKPFVKAANFVPFSNSAGQAIRGYERELITYVIGISLYVPVTTNIVTKQRTYVNHINETAFRLLSVENEKYPAGELKLNAYNGDNTYDNSGWYKHVDAEFEWNPEGWDLDVRDEGTSYATSGTGSPGDPFVRKLVFDASGNPAIIDLDGHGRKLANPPLPVALPYFIEGGIVYHKFQQFVKVEFTGIF